MKNALGTLITIAIIGWFGYRQYLSMKLDDFVEGHNAFNRVFSEVANMRDGDEIDDSYWRRLASQSYSMANDKQGCKALLNKTIREECSTIYNNFDNSIQNYLRTHNDYDFIYAMTTFAIEYKTLNNKISDKYPLEFSK